MPKSQEDNTNAGQPGADEAVDTEVQNPEATEAVSETEAPEAGQTEKSSEVLDALDGESLRRMVRDLRRESGNYRTQLQKVRDAQVKSEEEFNTLRKDLESREAELLRERVGATVGVPAELRARLQGATEEEILADARKVASLVKPSSAAFDDSTPSGGLDTASAPSVSPADLAAQARSQRY